MMCRFPAGVALGALLTSTAFLSPLAAFAQTAPSASATPASTPAANKPGSDKTKADTTKADRAMGAMKAYFDAKLAGLHAGLELTPDQTPLWTPVEAAIRDLATVHAATHRDGGDDGAPMDSLHQLKRMSEHLIRGGQAMKAPVDATGPLLATLSDDQKARLPTLLDGMQPKQILAKAFNLPDDRDGDRGERDAYEGHRGYEHPRHHDDADEERGPQPYGREEEGRDRGGPDHRFRGQDFGDRDPGRHDFGNRFYRDHEGRDGGEERDAGRDDERHEFDRDHHGRDGFRHHPDMDEERT